MDIDHQQAVRTESVSTVGDVELSETGAAPAPSLPQATPRRVKLRASCDTCGKAKIKCDRIQPSCSRCVSQGTPCVYGVSKKAGKPPRKRPAAVISPPSVPPSFQWPSATKRTSTDSGFGSETTSFTPNDELQDWLTFNELGPMGLPTSPLYSSDLDPSNSWKTYDPSTLVPSWPAPTSSMSSSTSPDPSASILLNAWLGDQEVWQTENWQNKMWNDQTPITSSVCCTQKAKEIMRRLYCADPSSSDPNGEPARVLDLGSILIRNRDVVTRLRELLSCPCARTPHCAMLYASVISRVLLWYSKHTIANPTTTDLQHSAASLFSTPTGSGITSSPVMPIPLSLGLFQTENKGLQSALIACLLMSELSTVGDLINEFTSIGQKGPADFRHGTHCPLASEHSCVSTNMALFESLGSCLWTEQRRIVCEARTGVSMLDNSLHVRA